MSQILSPEHSTRELEGEVELEELAEELEPEEKEVDSYDLVYGKDHRETSDSTGSVYVPEGTGSDWYDEEDIKEVRIEDFEIDVQQVKLNAVTGETVLVDSDGDETRYDVFSSFEGTTTFTQKVGRNRYVFRYDKREDEEEDKVRATKIGDKGETVEWQSDELKKRVLLVDRLYHESRRNLWESKKQDEQIKAQNSKFQRLRPVYNAVLDKIEEEGRAVIKENDHVGDIRGPDVANMFFTAVDRHPDDSVDNYEESSGRGNSSTEITESE